MPPDLFLSVLLISTAVAADDGADDQNDTTRTEATAKAETRSKRRRRPPPPPPGADGYPVDLGIMAGSGLSLVGAGDRTLIRPSPIFLLVDLGLPVPSPQWLQFSPAALLEVQDRVGLGLEGRARASWTLSRVSPYVLGGVSGFVAPYRLVGIVAGVGLSVRLHPYLALCAEGAARAYFWGNDLIPGRALAKFDGTAGIRVYF